jgi:hypothetical protein
VPTTEQEPVLLSQEMELARAYAEVKAPQTTTTGLPQVPWDTDRLAVSTAQAILASLVKATGVELAEGLGELLTSLACLPVSDVIILQCKRPYLLQKFTYSRKFSVRRHQPGKVMDTVSTASRGQVFGQVDCLYTFASGSLQITLFTWAHQRLGEVGQVKLSVAVEGCVENGNALIYQCHCSIGLAQLQQAETMKAVTSAGLTQYR